MTESADLSKTSNPEAIVSKAATQLGFSIHDILRYGFTGTITLFVYMATVSTYLPAVSSILHQSGNPQSSAPGAAPSPSSASGLIKNLGTEVTGAVGLAFFTLSLGVVVYIMTRQTLIATSCGILWYLCSRSSLSRQCFLRNLSLTYVQGEVAWFILRTYEDSKGKPLWSRSIQEQLFRQHSENHLIYSLSFVCFASCIIQVVRSQFGFPRADEVFLTTLGDIVNCCVCRILDQAASCRIPSMKMRP